MKKILFITLLIVHCTVFIAQAQKYDFDVTVKRGDYKELVFKHKGDVTAKILSFVVKLTRDQSSDRLVFKRNTIAGGDTNQITASYASLYTTITVKILSEDTRDLSAKIYYYDLASIEPTDSNKEVTLFDGKFNIPWDVQSPFDGTNLPGGGVRITTVSLANGTTLYDIPLWDTTNHYWYPVSLSELKDLLNLTTSSTGNADSLGDRPASDYALKNTVNDSTFYYVTYPVTPNSIDRIAFNSKGLVNLGNILIDTNYLYIDKVNFRLGLLQSKDATNPSNITQSTNFRFTTDTEKSTWNAKQNAMGSDDNYVTDAEKTKLSNLSGTNTGDQDLSGYSLTTHNHTGTYEPVKGADDNYVTDAEKTKLSNLSGTNTGDQDLSGYSLTTHNHTGTYEPVKGADDNYVTDAEKIVIGNTSGTNTGDNATNSQYSGLATSKLNVSDAQLFVDSVYRSNDTIYFKQKDGSLLFFVDQNTGGEGDTIPYTAAEMNALLDSVNNAGIPLSLIDDKLNEKQNTLTAGSIGATEIASTTVTPGSYTSADITVDADGRITAASNGTGGTPTDSADVAGWGFITLEDVPGGSLTTAQITQIAMTWEYLQIDTTGAIGTFTDSTNAALSTQIASNIIALTDTAGVVRVSVDSAEFRVKHNRTGTPTWTDWTGTAGYYKDPDSVQVRHYSSASTSTTTSQRFFIANDVDIFTVTTVAGGSYDADAQAYFDVVTLGDNRKDTINTFIEMLKDSLSLTNLSDKFDGFWLFANTNETAALTNLVYPDSVATNVGSTTFSIDRGYTGNAGTETMYINSGMFLNSQTNFSLSDASYGVYIRTDLSEALAMGGRYTTPSTVRIEIYPRHSGGDAYGAMNISTYINATVSSSQGLTTIVRRSATDMELYRNGGSLGTSSTDNSSAYLMPVELYFLARNNDGIADNWSSNQIAIGFFGAGLTDDDVRKLYNCIEWYLDAIGAGVVP